MCLVKWAIDRAALGIDRITTSDESKYSHELFLIYEYEDRAVCGCYKKAGKICSRNQRIYCSFDTRFSPSEMTLCIVPDAQNPVCRKV